MDQLELFNRLAHMAHRGAAEYRPTTSLDVPWSQIGLDSMDTLMVTIFYADIYGLSDEAAKQMRPESPAQMIAYVMANKTKEPDSIDTAIAELDW